MNNRLLPLLILAACLLLGCASGTTPTPDALIQSIPIPPPASLTQAPPQLPPAASGQLADLEANHLQVTRAYHQLAARMCNLLAFLEISRDECQHWADAP
ncbi:MAG: hypothetical protein V4772_25425 [Pseudomonadota bacterium]